MASLTDALSRLQPADADAALAAGERQASLAKPDGSLGVLEILGSRLAAIAGRCPPPVPAHPVVTVFAGDHGVLSEGVSPWPSEATARMVANVLGGGAAVNVIARQAGVAVLVVDAGVATTIPDPPGGPTDDHGGPRRGRLVSAKVRRGTANLVSEAAISLEEARRSIQLGLSVADRLVDQGTDLIVTGEMGAGNTTPSAAVVAAVTGWPARAVTGRGSGISDEMLDKKIAVVEAGLERVAASHSVATTALSSLDGDVLLSELGGLEIGAIAGVVIGGALRRVPVVLDGLGSLAGALVAVKLAPVASEYLVAGHRSVEPGATAAMEHLGLEPLLDMRLGLGEGTGGCLAVPVVKAAAGLLNEMATSEDAGVSASTTS